MNDTLPLTVTRSAAVIEQSLLAFGAGMSLEVRADIKQAFHFATLVASREFPGVSQTEQWFDLYCRVMQDCGWVSLRRSYERESSSSQSLKLGAIAFKGMKVIGQAVLSNPVTDALAQLAAEALEGLGKITEAQELLKRNLREKNASTAGLAACVQNPSGEILLVVSAVNARPVDEHALDTVVFEWQSMASEVYTGNVVMVFHRELYTAVRETIVTRLGERAVRNVLEYKV